MQKAFFFLLVILFCVNSFAANSLLISDFNNNLESWNQEYGGQWQLNNGVYEGKTRSVWAGDKNWKNYRFSCKAKCVEGGEEGQIWLSVRYQNEWNRYAIAIRGGLLDEIALFRYREAYPPEAPVFCPLNVPLGFNFESNTWYDIIVEVNGSQIKIRVGDVNEFQIVYEDNSPLLSGAVAIGGNYHLCQFDNVKVENVEKELSADSKHNFPVVSKEKVAERTKTVEKYQKRIKQRSEYKPVNTHISTVGRTEVSLDGKWLFMPEQNLAPKANPASPECSDDDWHVMNVPGFWNQISWWIMSFGPYGMTGQDTSFHHDEARRTAEYTFDYGNTNSAWYRHWINVPQNSRGKRVIIKFDAIASVSAVYVNGTKVGEHIGMFTPFKFDITDHIKFGKDNLIAVHVSRQTNTATVDNNDVAGVAVTMVITNEMLNSLPKGITGGLSTTGDYRFQSHPRLKGIWQPVTLYFTSPVVLDDVFFKPDLNGANVEVTIDNSDKFPFEGEIQVEIAGKKMTKAIHLNSEEKKTWTLRIDVKTPRLWSPENPNLYDLSIQLKRDSKLLDDYSCRVGFRTFTVEGDRFYLNGRPRWMGGADMPPHGLRPNDSELANKFFKLMHDGNQMITRAVCSPLTKTWATASDQQGVAVSLEGTWPWLMLGDAEMASEFLLDVWRQEMRDLVISLRNHPSIVMWTVGNEFNWHPGSDKYIKKMKILTEMIKEIRKLDPTRPVCAWSGYSRVYENMEEGIHKANQIDDGDITDLHRYSGWYQPSIFQDNQYNGKYVLPYRGQAIISQEASTGYPNNDNGSPCRNYIQLYVPQTWIGDESYEHRDPSTFLAYNALISKEWMEDVRRSRLTAGWMAFCNSCWFKYVSFADHIKAYPTYDAMKKALQPVLPSLDQRDRHYYQGNKFSGKIVVVNDDIKARDFSSLQCDIALVSQEGKELVNFTREIGACEYYKNLVREFSFAIPDFITDTKTECKLKLKLRNGKEVLGINEYELKIASKQWAGSHCSKGSNVLILNATEPTASYLEALGGKNGGIDDINTAEVVIWANKSAPVNTSEQGQKLLNYVKNGGKLVLMQTANVHEFLPSEMSSIFFSSRFGNIWSLDESSVPASQNVEFANIEVPQHPLFEGFDSQDIRWWNGNGTSPKVAELSYILAPDSKCLKLCEHVPNHGYGWKGPLTYPLFLIDYGEGVILVSELCTSVCNTDPFAGRMLKNIIKWSTEDN